MGNGCTDERYDGNAHPLYAATKSLLPWRQFRQLEAECGGEYWNRTGGERGRGGGREGGGEGGREEGRQGGRKEGRRGCLYQPTLLQPS